MGNYHNTATRGEGRGGEGREGGGVFFLASFHCR